MRPEVPCIPSAEYICPTTDWKPKAAIWRSSMIGLGVALAILVFSNGFCVAYWLRDRERQKRMMDEAAMAHEVAAGAGSGAKQAAKGGHK